MLLASSILSNGTDCTLHHCDKLTTATDLAACLKHSGCVTYTALPHCFLLAPLGPPYALCIAGPHCACVTPLHQAACADAAGTPLHHLQRVKPGDLCLAMPPVHPKSLCKASIEGMRDLVINHLNPRVHSLSHASRKRVAALHPLADPRRSRSA